MFIATLIAKDRLPGGVISAAEDALRRVDVEPMGRSWIEEDVACDLLFSASLGPVRLALEGIFPGVDVIVQGEAGRRKRLLVADMDSTMITIECIDELADYAGIKAEISAVTERAMQGELDFESALTERVKLLKGLDASVIDRCHDERVRITPGAIALVRTMKREGARCILVSGGFTVFADRVAAEIGFDRAISNRLEVAGGKLKGSLGLPIVGAEAKREALVAEAAMAGIELEATLAVGDGANDIPMLQSAGLGVAFHAKPAAAAAADARIEYGDLGTLLYAQGYARGEWEAA
ncbi:MAG: phosphoserine phosphatase SerB [Sphingosinicella sp.]|nr:phosphoserine phosphatase SerB [Sphingosinicella sp.]